MRCLARRPEFLRRRAVVTDDAALRSFDVRPMSLAQAISRAMRNEDRKHALTRGSDAI